MLTHNSTTTATQTPNHPRKREHDHTHLDKRRHVEADCAIALDASLLQKYLGATTKRMPDGAATPRFFKNIEDQLVVGLGRCGC